MFPSVRSFTYMETRTHNERVAAEVRAAIARKGVSQTIVAHGAEMSNASLSRKLRGHYPFAVDELLAIAALAYDPQLVRRLQRLRDARAAQRRGPRATSGQLVNR